MAHSSSRWTARTTAVAGLVALGTLTGCGVGDPAANDATPAARVAPQEGTAAVATPEDRRAAGGPQAAARAYADFAAGRGGAAVPWAAQVTYCVGGSDVATLTVREARRPASWRACPPDESTYEGRACPVSPLRSLGLLEREGAPAQVEDGWPASVGCTRVDAAALGDGATAMSLRPPPQRRDCFSDVGVLLRVDEGGRIDLVELVLSGS